MLDYEFTWWPGADDEERLPIPEIPRPDPAYDYTSEAFADGSELWKFQGTNGDITLRDYQEKGARATYAEWERGHTRTMLVYPTGTGKTYVGAAIYGRYNEWRGPRRDGDPRRVLVTVHRDYLLKQWARAFVDLGMNPAIEKSGVRALGGLFGDPSIVLCSIQSMQANRASRRLFDWPRDYFDLVIPDECHRTIGRMHRTVLDYFDPAHVLGLTATPDRMDGQDLGKIFDSIAYEYPLSDALRSGWVCPIKVRWCDLRLDLSALKAKGKNRDLNDEDLAAVIAPHVERFARAIKREIGSRKTLVFCPTVKIAGAMAIALMKCGLSAASLDGESLDRDRVMADFERGDYQVLCNCELFTEGYDVPGIEAVVIMRPTNSRALYYQMVGRGLRPKDGGDLILVDFPWVSGRHHLIRPADLFRTDRFTQAQIDIAAAMLDTGETDDLMDAMSRAEILDFERERKRLDVRAKDGPVKYRKVEYDPFSDVEVKELPPREEVENRKVPASLAQVRILEQNGIPGGDAMSRAEASKMIKAIMHRRGVIKELIAYGYDKRAAWRLTVKEAHGALSAMKRASRSA